MIALFINLLVLAQTLWRGVREDPEFRALVVAMVGILGASTLFYWQAEGWSLVDSLYFCVITMATIGYGDLAPTSPSSKLFTVGFVILGVGLFATFVGKIVALMVKQRGAWHHRHHPVTNPPPSKGEKDVSATQVAVVDTKLYDTRTEQMFWSAHSDTFWVTGKDGRVTRPRSVHIRWFVETIIKAMSNSNVL